MVYYGIFWGVQLPPLLLRSLLKLLQHYRDPSYNHHHLYHQPSPTISHFLIFTPLFPTPPTTLHYTHHLTIATSIIPPVISPLPPSLLRSSLVLVYNHRDPPHNHDHPCHQPLPLHSHFLHHISWLPQVKKWSRKIKFLQGQGKVREFHFDSGKIEKKSLKEVRKK